MILQYVLAKSGHMGGIKLISPSVCCTYMCSDKLTGFFQHERLYKSLAAPGLVNSQEKQQAS